MVHLIAAPSSTLGVLGHRLFTTIVLFSYNKNLSRFCQSRGCTCVSVSEGTH